MTQNLEMWTDRFLVWVSDDQSRHERCGGLTLEARMSDLKRDPDPDRSFVW